MNPPKILEQQRNCPLVQHRTVILDNVGQKFKLASSHQVFSFLVLLQIKNELLQERIQEQVLGHVFLFTFRKHR